MKKIYATIFAALIGSSMMVAQNNTFSFTFSGETVSNGATVVVAETNVQDLDGFYIIDMNAPLRVKNVSNASAMLSLVCTGVDNYEDIAFCPNGSCKPWIGTELSTDYVNAIAPGTIADDTNWLHVEKISDTSAMTFCGTVQVKAINSENPDDFVTVTVKFDTNGQQGIQGLRRVNADRRVEVYNLCGRKIANSTNGLAKGVYIIKQGGTSRKVVIR